MTLLCHVIIIKYSYHYYFIISLLAMIILIQWNLSNHAGPLYRNTSRLTHYIRAELKWDSRSQSNSTGNDQVHCTYNYYGQRLLLIYFADVAMLTPYNNILIFNMTRFKVQEVVESDDHGRGCWRWIHRQAFPRHRAMASRWNSWLVGLVESWQHACWAPGQANGK